VCEVHAHLLHDPPGPPPSPSSPGGSKTIRRAACGVTSSVFANIPADISGFAITSSTSSDSFDEVRRPFSFRLNIVRASASRVSEFSYVATWQGFVYVAFVIDAFARRIVDWRASRTAHAGSSWMLSTRRFMMGGRSNAPGWFIIPTAAQYVSIRYSERLAEAEAGIEPSVGSVGGS
jgi:transposase InsO family protein